MVRAAAGAAARGALGALRRAVARAARPLRAHGAGAAHFALAYVLSVAAGGAAAGRAGRARRRCGGGGGGGGGGGPPGAALRAAAAAGRHLWVVNLGVNLAAAAWSLRFWRQTEAVSLCRALPLGGDTARTIRVVGG
jgi:hypothetical protein